MQLKYSDNWPALKRELQLIEKNARKITVATVSNNARQAVAIHLRSGFYLFNDERLFKLVKREIRNLENLGITLHKRHLENAVRRGIIKYVNWLRSTTGTAPPFRKGSGPRRAHPGKWADITGLLNNSYRFRINQGKWEVTPEWAAGKAAAETKFRQLYPNAK